MNAPAPTAAQVVFGLIPRFNMMALTTTIEPLRVTNYLSSEQRYQWHFHSAEGGEVVASNGMQVETETLDSAPTKPALVFVCGSWGSEHYDQPELTRWLRKLHRRGVQLAAMELGIYALARAGLIRDQAVTTHWSWMPGFAEQFPEIKTTERLYTVTPRLITCAGGTAGLDLMLNLVKRDHGEQLAMEVADQIMHYPVRPGDTTQRQTLGARKPAVHPAVKIAVAMIEENLVDPPSVPDMAESAGVSQRQLERLFRQDMGCTVVQFSQLFRLQHARVLLTSTRLSVREVSTACGFNSMSYFSQAFMRCFARRPSDYRQAWPEMEPAPAWPGSLFTFATPDVEAATPARRSSDTPARK